MSDTPRSMGDSRWWSARSQQERRDNRTRGFSVGREDPLREAAGVRRPRVAVPRRGTPEYDRMVAEQQARQSDELRAQRRADAAAARAQGVYGTGGEYLDPNTPNLYLPLAEMATAALEMPDYVRANLGDAEAARRIAGQPARALDMSRGMRSVGEFLIGPEEILGMADRLGTGEGDVLDAALLPLTVLPGPTGNLVKRAIPSSVRRRVRGAVDWLREPVEGALPSAQTSAPTARIVRQAAERPSVNIGLAVEPDMYTSGRREQIAPLAAQQALSDLGVNVERSQVRMSGTEPTLVAELDRALSPEEAFAVSQGLRQKAIAQVDPATGGALHGPMAEDWGTFNPDYYLGFDPDAASFAVRRRDDITDPVNALSVYEMDRARRQLLERDLIGGMTRPGGLRDEQAAELLAQFPPEEALRMRLAEMGADTIEMPAEWQASLAVPRRFETGRAPTSAAGVHYSRVSGLTQTDPSFYGTGHRGAEIPMVHRERLPSRTYFYAEGADGSPIQPEEPVAQRAPFIYDADLQNLYDVNADPEQLLALARAHAGQHPLSGEVYQPVSPPYVFQGTDLKSGAAIPDLERLVRQYGYSGYIVDYAPSWAPQSRRAAAVFDPVSVRQR